jgi:hypothetical protein
MSEDESRIGDRIGGGALIAAALGTVFTMAHHPTGMHGGGLGGIVHGAMILLLGLLTFGFVRFGQRQGFEQPLILAGGIAYLASFLAHIGAATINGFVVPALAGGEPPVSHDLFRFAWHSNQALAKLGVVATGLAYLCWGAELARNRRTRWLGTAGIVTGIVPAILLAAGVIRMDVAGAFVAYAAHALWALLLGAAMWRGTVRG